MPCKGCGWCCKNIFLTYPVPEQNRERERLFDWMEHRGAKVTAENSKMVIFRLRHVCPWLSGTGCTSKHKPYACELYPQQLRDYARVGFDPARILHHGCGYRWIEAKEVFE